MRTRSAFRSLFILRWDKIHKVPDGIGEEVAERPMRGVQVQAEGRSQRGAQFSEREGWDISLWTEPLCLFSFSSFLFSSLLSFPSFPFFAFLSFPSLPFHPFPFIPFSFPVPFLIFFSFISLILSLLSSI